MKKPLIETPKGIGMLEDVYVSELGFLMIKISFENGTFMSYNLGKHEEDNNIFTNKLLKDVGQTVCD